MMHRISCKKNRRKYILWIAEDNGEPVSRIAEFDDRFKAKRVADRLNTLMTAAARDGFTRGFKHGEDHVKYAVMRAIGRREDEYGTLYT